MSGLPPRGQLADGDVELLGAQTLHGLRECADAGQHESVRLGEPGWVVGAHHAGSDALEGLLDRTGGCRGRDRRARRSRSRRRSLGSERALRRRDARSRGVDRHGLAHGPGQGLERPSITWWAFVPARTSRWTVARAPLANARTNSSSSSCSKPPVTPGTSCGALTAVNGRPERSIAQRASVSSIGIVALP